MKKFEKELEAKVQELFLEITGEKLTKAEADRFVNTFEAWMKQAIADGESIQWTKFFTMKPAIKKATAERQGRNPRTGEPITIPAKPEQKTVKLTASKAWRDSLNEV